MSLRDKYKKTNDAKFEPLELNEMNVQAIFKRCLTNTDSPKPGVDLSATLFDTLGGYNKDYQSVNFNIKKIKENTATIKYLFGQLKTVHQGKQLLSPEASSQNYLGNSWTNNNRNINGISLLR